MPMTVTSAKDVQTVLRFLGITTGRGIDRDRPSEAEAEAAAARLADASEATLQTGIAGADVKRQFVRVADGVALREAAVAPPRTFAEGDTAEQGRAEAAGTI